MRITIPNALVQPIADALHEVSKAKIMEARRLNRHENQSGQAFPLMRMSLACDDLVARIERSIKRRGIVGLK
jgi:hypothetical protein